VGLCDLLEPALDEALPTSLATWRTVSARKLS
jgi:hypothetical protein